MALLVKRINLEVDREYYSPIQAQQSDSARSLEFVILSNGLQVDLSNISIKLIAIKPDNTKIYNDLTVSNNVATLDLTTQLLAVTGKVKCQLQLIKDSKILRTIIFYIDVKESLDVTGAIESTNEFTALENAIETLNTWNNYFEENSGKIEEKYTTRLSSAEDNITLLQKSVKTNTTNITTNKTNIQTNKTNIAELQTSVANNTTDISTLKTKTNIITSSTTIASGNAVLLEGCNNKVSKKDNEVMLDVCVRYKTLNSNSLTADSTLFTLPEGFRPSKEVKVPVVLGRSGSVNSTVGMLTIGTDGKAIGAPFDGIGGFYNAYCQGISFPID